MITLLKSKIHRATVTDANIDYEGSITISRDLVDRRICILMKKYWLLM